MRPFIVTALALATYASVPAIAQDRASDAAYCERLYGLWSRHLAPMSTNPRVGRIDQDSAVARCRKGDTAGGIAILEKTLRDNHFSLPPR
jgi:hypothetical protein